MRVSRRHLARTAVALVAVAVAVALAAVWLGAGTPRPADAPVAIGPPEPDSLTIVFFGDSGMATELQLRVADTMLRVCRRLGCDLGLMLGDNVYAGERLRSADDPYLARVLGRPFAPFADLESKQGDFVFWVVLGNHDMTPGLDAQLDYVAASPILELPAPAYAVPGLPDWLQLFGLHTTTIFKAETPRSNDPRFAWRAQVARAEEYLCDPARSGWKILFGHHPIHSTAHGTARRMRERLLPTIRRCGVDVLLAGHVHQQEHIHTADFDQLIQGASSSPRPSRTWLKRAPPSSFRSTEAGFGVLRIAPESVLVDFFDADGRVIYSFRRYRE